MTTRTGTSRWALAALAALGVLAAWSRFVPLGGGLWSDETFTVQRYVVHGLPAILDPARYELNNHVLFSALVWASRPLVGLSEPAVRLWSVLPALAAAAVLTWAAWRRFGPSAAVAVAALLVLDPVGARWAPQARGYGLALLAAAVMLVAAERLEARPAPTWRHGAALGLGGLVGAATLPVMAIPAAAHVAVAARRRGAWTAAGTAAAILAGGAGALYHGHVGALLRLSGEAATDYGWPLAGWDVARAPASLLLAPVGERLVPWAPAAVGAGLAGLLLLAGAVALGAAPARRPLLAHAALPTVVTVAALALLEVHVTDRYLSYLQPGLLVVMAAGAVGAGALLGRLGAPLAGRRDVRAVAAAGLGGLLAAAAVDLGSHAHWQASVPREAHRGSVEIIEASGIDRVLTNHPQPTGLLHYREGAQPTVIDPRHEGAALCEAPAPFAFVDQPLERPSGDLSCLERRGGTELVLPQRHDPGYTAVWIVDEDRR